MIVGYVVSGVIPVKYRSEPNSTSEIQNQQTALSIAKERTERTKRKRGCLPNRHWLNPAGRIYAHSG